MEIITPQYHGEGRYPDSFIDQPAGFIRRVIAYLVDSSIIFILYLLFSASGLMGIQLAGGTEGLFYTGSLAVFLSAFLFLYTGYFTFFHGYGGQTPAKMILRIKVVTTRGTPLSHLHAFIRTLGFFVSHLFFGLGFLITIIERKKRALHDLLSGTQVILAQ